MSSWIPQVHPEITQRVTRLLSNPRREADPLEAQEILPDDAKERLRKSLQSCLRQTLLLLLSGLNMSEVGTSKLLSVPVRHLHTLLSGSKVQGLACAEQWAALKRRVGVRMVTQRRRDLVVSGISQYEPNLRLQALSTVVHRPGEAVLLRCTECSHPLSSSWYFVHPCTDAAQVMTPMSGHARCRVLCKRVCHFRSKDWHRSILDVFTHLDFCEHKKLRKNCVLCDGSDCCTHGRRRYRCCLCDGRFERRKKL